MDRIEAPAGTQAVVRALRLLRAFTPAQPELSLAQLSTSQGLKKTTAYRLLLALESEGLVERSAGTYHLGPEVIALGSQALLTSDLRLRVRPTLERIAAQTGEATTLEVLVGDHVLILDGVRGRHVVSASLEIGVHWPVHATSTGKCLVARLPETSQRRLLELGLPSFTEQTVTDPDLLLGELEAIRSRGFAVANQELEPDYVAIAAAFGGPMRDVEGALSVGGPVSRFPEQRIEVLGKLLRLEAERLSRSHLRVGA